MSTYAAVHAASLADPHGFWADAARAITWSTQPTVVCDESRAPLYRWFPDGRLNTCYNALDRHVEAGHGDRTALVHVSPVTASERILSYAQLLDEVARFAGALAGLGVVAGDRVVLSMPMVPEDDRRDAGVRAAGRDALGGLRGIRCSGAGGAHRRRAAQGDLSASCAVTSPTRDGLSIR